jgi:hypothetical protein
MWCDTFSFYGPAMPFPDRKIKMNGMKIYYRKRPEIFKTLSFYHILSLKGANTVEQN